jgi:hypothetical protein
MTRVVVTAETREWTTRERDPSDPWDNGGTAGEVSNVVAFLEEREVSYYGESHGKDIPGAKIGDTVYAVVADYESGCTFGRSGGHAQVLDFFDNPAEAKALAEAALTPDGKEERWGRQVDRFDYQFTHNGQDYGRSWIGYFESLNSLDVWECRIKGTAKDPWSDDPNPGFRVGR